MAKGYKRYSEKLSGENTTEKEATHVFIWEFSWSQDNNFRKLEPWVKSVGKNEQQFWNLSNEIHLLNSSR